MRTHYSREISAEMDGKEVRICGWVQNVRNIGSLAFLRVRDREGFIQIIIKEPKFLEQARKISPETVVFVTGTVTKSDKAERGFEIIPKEIEVLSAAQVPLPLDMSGKIESEFDTRINSRFMDLRNPKIRAIFVIRDHLIAAIHKQMDKEGFIEMHTPKIVAEGAEGGSTLFPVEYFGKKAYLAQSPQLFKQMMMATGFDKVYEIAPYFRAEASATVRHLSQFTGLDCEMAFIKSYKDVVKFIERTITGSISHVQKHAAPYLELLGKTIEVPKKPYLKLTYSECMKLLGRTDKGDIGTEDEKKLGEIVRKEYGGPMFFLTEFPTELKKQTFYIYRLSNRRTSAFDLVYNGQELLSGNQREHRYDVLVSQIKEAGLNPESFHFYLNAFKYGMPPHGGFGLGIDRFVQKMLGLPNIREAVLFPRDQFRLVP